MEYLDQLFMRAHDRATRHARLSRQQPPLAHSRSKWDSNSQRCRSCCRGRIDVAPHLDQSQRSQKSGPLDQQLDDLEACSPPSGSHRADAAQSALGKPVHTDDPWRHHRN